MPDERPNKPQDQLDLVKMLAQADRLRDRVNALRPLVGSEAAAAIEAGFLPALAWRHASVALIISSDNLRGMQAIAAQLPRPVFVHLPVLRSAMEGACLSRWLLAPEIGPIERMARGYGAERRDVHDLRDMRAVDPDIDDKLPGRGPVKEPDELEAMARDAGISDDGPWLPKIGRLITEYGVVPSAAQHERRVLYALLSAAPHARRWALYLTTQDDSVLGRFMTRVRLNTERVQQLTAIALGTLTVALDEAEQYCGMRRRAADW